MAVAEGGGEGGSREKLYIYSFHRKKKVCAAPHSRFTPTTFFFLLLPRYDLHFLLLLNSTCVSRLLSTSLARFFLLTFVDGRWVLAHSFIYLGACRREFFSFITCHSLMVVFVQGARDGVWKAKFRARLGSAMVGVCVVGVLSMEEEEEWL